MKKMENLNDADGGDDAVAMVTVGAGLVHVCQ